MRLEKISTKSLYAQMISVTSQSIQPTKVSKRFVINFGKSKMQERMKQMTIPPTFPRRLLKDQYTTPTNSQSLITDKKKSSPFFHKDPESKMFQSHRSAFKINSLIASAIACLLPIRPDEYFQFTQFT